jgi:hypothetical protein
MSDNLTVRLEAFESQVASEHTALMAAIAALQSSMDLVASNTDLALENGAANTKALLAALGQTGTCFPCPTPSITVPPTATTSSPIDPAHCQRSQWIVTAIQNILTQFDTLQSFNVIGSFNVLNDAISQIVGAIAAGDTIPLPSFPETVNIAGDYVSYAGERAFSGVSLSTQFAPLYGPLVTAVNFSSDASSAQAAYDAVIDASSASNGAKLLFKALAYNALWSYAFDASSTPDLTAFDGGACGGALHGITACTNFGSAEVDHGGHQFFELVIPVAYAGHPAYITGDYFGWSFQVLTNTFGHAVGIYYLDTGDAGHLAVSQNEGDTAYTFAVHTNAVAVQTLDHEPDDFPFTIRICPPS